jgi:hypothetical protein
MSTLDCERSRTGGLYFQLKASRFDDKKVSHELEAKNLLLLKIKAYLDAPSMT